MPEKLEVVRDGPTFAVKITYHSGYTQIERGFPTEAEAESWVENRRERTASAVRIARDQRSI
jgi:hypothetical protein